MLIEGRLRALRWLLPLCLTTVGLAAAEERPTVGIPRLEAPPVFEDFLDMQPPPGHGMGHVSGFIQQDPEDGEPATQRTDVYFGYDDRAMHFVFVAHDTEPDKIRAHMNRREKISGDDLVEVMLDAYGDEQRAFAFIVTAGGVQWDAVWTEGRGFDSTWDAVWDSKARLTPGGYVVQMAIPFKSLRFPADAGHDWKMVLIRDIPRATENAFWPRVSNRIEGRLSQSATLTGLEGISPGRNMQLIPYATARNFEVLNEEDAEIDEDDFDPDAGLDAKMVFKDTLALDLTFNPDFSQVESDLPQITVNERFEVFFPERRPFFLENADYFRTPINLLFTRRIADPRTGARLTGKLGSFALGTLVIDDEAPASGSNRASRERRSRLVRRGAPAQGPAPAIAHRRDVHGARVRRLLQTGSRASTAATSSTTTGTCASRPSTARRRRSRGRSWTGRPSRSSSIATGATSTRTSTTATTTSSSSPNPVSSPRRRARRARQQHLHLPSRGAVPALLGAQRLRRADRGSERRAAR